MPRALALALAAALGALAPAAAAASWSAPVRVSPPDRASYGGAAVAAGTGGASLAAWIRTPAGAPRRAGRMQIATRPEGRAWTAPRIVSGPGADMARVALNDRADAAAAWLNGRRIVAVVRQGASGAWRPARVVDAEAPVQDLRVALDRRGRATVAWVERRGEGFQVRVATSGAPGATWSVRPPRLTTPGPEPPSLALSPGRGALAAWRDGARALAARTVAGAFERPVELSRAGGGSPPAAGLGPAGAALAAWSVRLPGGTSVMQAAGRPAAAPRWGTADDVGIGGAPVVALNDAGDAVVAWGASASGALQSVSASTRRAGGLWRATIVVAPFSCRCELRAVDAAIDGTGAALVAWQRDDGDDGRRAGASALEPGGDRWAPAPIAAARVTGAPAVAAAAEQGAASAWSQEGAGGGVRVAHHTR